MERLTNFPKSHSWEMEKSEFGPAQSKAIVIMLLDFNKSERNIEGRKKINIKIKSEKYLHGE